MSSCGEFRYGFFTHQYFRVYILNDDFDWTPQLLTRADYAAKTPPENMYRAALA